MSGSVRCLGGTGGKIGLNVKKWSFSQGLSRDFSRLPLTHQNTLFYTFSDQIHSLQISKSSILDKFQTVPSFSYPLLLSILGLSFKFYYAPHPVIIEVTLAKISFRKIMPTQSYRGKTLEGGST